MNFKKGDRVAVYSGKGRELAVVTSTYPIHGSITIKLEDGMSSCVHPKQCRKLRKRKEIWATEKVYKTFVSGDWDNFKIEKPADTTGWIRFVEKK